MNLRKTSKMMLGLSLKIVFWIICLTVFIVICSRAFSLGSQVFGNEGMAKEGSGTEVTVTIPQGATDKDVAEILLDEELISSKYIFMVQARIYEASYAPGDYVLSTEQGCLLYTSPSPRDTR